MRSRFRHFLFGLLGFLSAIVTYLLTPGQWLNRLVAVALCTVLTADNVCLPKNYSQSVAATPTELEKVEYQSNRLVAQRSDEFDDNPVTPVPSRNVAPPPFPIDPGPSQPLRRPDFDDLSENTGLFDIALFNGYWLFSMTAVFTDTEDQPFYEFIMSLNHTTEGFNITECLADCVSSDQLREAIDRQSIPLDTSLLIEYGYPDSDETATEVELAFSRDKQVIWGSLRNLENLGEIYYFSLRKISSVLVSNSKSLRSFFLKDKIVDFNLKSNIDIIIADSVNFNNFNLQDSQKLQEFQKQVKKEQSKVNKTNLQPQVDNNMEKAKLRAQANDTFTRSQEQQDRPGSNRIGNDIRGAQNSLALAPGLFDLFRDLVKKIVQDISNDLDDLYPQSAESYNPQIDRNPPASSDNNKSRPEIVFVDCNSQSANSANPCSIASRQLAQMSFGYRDRDNNAQSWRITDQGNPNNVHFRGDLQGCYSHYGSCGGLHSPRYYPQGIGGNCKQGSGGLCIHRLQLIVTDSDGLDSTPYPFILQIQSE